MARKGNGWIIQVYQDGIVSEIGDWDLRSSIERKLFSEVVRESGK